MTNPAEKWAAEAVNYINKAKSLFANMVAALGSEEAAAALLNTRQEGAAALLLGPSARPMQRLVARLFAEAPKLLDDKMEPRPDQAPALECNVTLTCGREIAGSLSMTPEGTFRMMSPAQAPDDHPLAGKLIMLEAFFTIEEISAVTLIRDLTVEKAGSLIIQPS